MYHSHCDVTLDEYITDKVQNQRGGQYSFSLQKYKKINVQTHHFW